MYVEKAWFLLPVAVLLFVPLGLVEALGEHAFEVETHDLDPAKIARALVGIAVAAGTSSLGEVLYAGAVMSAVTESMEGRARSSLRTLVRTLPYGGLIAVDLLFALGLAVGLVLLVVPGLVFFARYVLAAPLLELERTGVRWAFSRSRSLARGHALGLLLLLGSLFLATDVLTSVLRDSGLSRLGDTLLAEWVVATVVGVVVTPVWGVAVCVVTWRLLRLERNAPAAAIPAMDDSSR